MPETGVDSIQSDPHATTSRDGPTASEHHVDKNPDIQYLPDDGASERCHVKLALSIQRTIYTDFRKNKDCLRRVVLVILLLAYVVYFGFAIQHDWKGSIPLIICTALGLLLALYKVVGKKIKIKVWKRWRDLTSSSSAQKALKILRWLIPLCILLGFIIFVIVDNKNEPQHLISALGIVVFIFTGVVFSIDATKIEWRILLMGLLIQFILGLISLRWSHGFSVLDWLGDQMITFLGFSDEGSRFVFGETFMDHVLVFQALTVIIFFGAVMEIMYFFGILQSLIRGLGSIMIVLMGVGPTESFVAAANIFLGPNNSALTVGRFLDTMTLSELHCVMTSGFATVTGSLFGLYTNVFGISPSHLVAASFMSAPAALCIAKVYYPEVDQSTLKDVKSIKFPNAGYRDPWDALRGGANEGAKIVVHITANLIAFVAALAFFNATLEWFGDRVGVEGLTFQWLCSYLFIPLPFLMGVETSDCREVARLIGTKIFLTDIFGYEELGQMITNRIDGLDGPTISPRSEVIATYALCGFANIPDVSICLAAIGAIAPSRKSDLARVAVRAMVAGNVACYITACVVGLLYKV